MTYSGPTWLATWKCADGKVVRVGAMHTDHIMNCIKLLQRRHYAIQNIHPCVYVGDSDAAEMAVEAENRNCEMIMEECEEWIELFRSELERRKKLKTPKTFLSLTQLHDGLHAV